MLASHSWFLWLIMALLGTRAYKDYVQAKEGLQTEEAKDLGGLDATGVEEEDIADDEEDANTSEEVADDTKEHEESNYEEENDGEQGSLAPAVKVEVKKKVEEKTEEKKAAEAKEGQAKEEEGAGKEEKLEEEGAEKEEEVEKEEIITAEEEESAEEEEEEEESAEEEEPAEEEESVKQIKGEETAAKEEEEKPAEKEANEEKVVVNEDEDDEIVDEEADKELKDVQDLTEETGEVSMNEEDEKSIDGTTGDNTEVDSEEKNVQVGPAGDAQYMSSSFCCFCSVCEHCGNCDECPCEKEQMSAHCRICEEILQRRGESQRLHNVYLDVLAFLVQFLRPFYNAQRELEGDKYPTLNLVVPWLHKLKRHCQPDVSDTPSQAIIRQRHLEWIMKKVHIQPLHKLAIFLWPKFSQLRMFSDTERDDIHQLARHHLARFSIRLREEGTAAERADLATAGTTVAAPAVAAKKRALAEFEEEWENIVEQEEDTDEVQLYLRLNPNMEGDGRDVLRWWYQQENMLPHLSRLARMVFSVPASSSSSERAFSTAGRILEERRTRLKTFHCGCCAFSAQCFVREQCSVLLAVAMFRFSFCFYFIR